MLPLLALTLGFAQAPRPNVVVVVADDQGWGDLSLHGNGNLQTPHLDALAKSGAQFERFFVQPVCSPTRAEFLTGRYHLRSGVRGVTNGGERFSLDETTIAQHFQKAGYQTGYFGKWHGGSQYPYHPRGRGFDTYFGFTSGHWADYFDAPLDHDGTDVRGKGYLADELTERCIAFSKSSTPTFAVLALNTPHSPMQAPAQYWDRFKTKELTHRGGKNEDLPHTRAALAMVENIDDNIGKLVKSLGDDTIIVYFSDNGPNGARWNGGMRGTKGSTDEGGVRSPLFVRWPGQVPAGKTIPGIAAAIDLLPTLCELTGVQVVGGKPLDGISFAAELRGAKVERADRQLFQFWNGKTSVRTQQYRRDAAGKLYDMLADPGQLADIAAQHPKLSETLSASVRAWEKEVGANEKPQPRPLTVGYREFPRSVLPARDGTPAGGVQRSARAPNCSYFTNWTNTRGTMTWPIRIHTAGDYEAIIHYTCPAADAGSEIQLRVGKIDFSATIATPFESPLRGHEIDLVPRVGESYMKDFRALALGRQTLSAGSYDLILSAVKVPGKSVADVRAVELHLK
jgi:arylsulfatase A-like enzyme